MKALWRRFSELAFLLKIIWIFCFLGAVINVVLIGRDFSRGSVLLRLHLAFLVLYVGQVGFILLRERMVFVLSLLQALVALWTNLDFTAVPVLRIVGTLLVMIKGQLSVDQLEVYKYVFVSLCFTLELLKTALLWILLTPNPTVCLFKETH